MGFRMFAPTDTEADPRYCGATKADLPDMLAVCHRAVEACLLLPTSRQAEAALNRLIAPPFDTLQRNLMITAIIERLARSA